MTFAAALALAFTAAAQEPRQVTLTLGQALDMALSDNPTVKVNEMEIRRYDYVKQSTWGNLLPQVSASGSYQHTFIKQNMSKGFEMGAKQYDNLQASLQLALPLFAPQVYRTLKLNRSQMEAAVETARANRITLASEVKKAYYNIQLAEQSLAVLRRSEATIRRTVEDTELRYNNGLVSEYDLLTAQVQLSNLRPTILQTENSIVVAKMLLKMYLSIPADVEIEVSGTLDGERETVFAGGAELSTDLSANSDLKQLDLQRDLLVRQLKVSNAGRLPVISAVGTFTMTGTNMGSIDWSSITGGAGGEGGAGAGGAMGMAGAKMDRSWYWQNPLVAGVQISVPIFGGLVRSSQAKSIKNQIRQLDLQREYRRQSIGVEVRTAINALLTAREQMFVQEKTVVQAEKAYAIADTRYRAGAGTILELNSAELSLTQARLNFSQSIYDFLSARAEYDRVMGREE